MSERLKIERLGAQGDGVAATGAGPLFVPFTLPGETVAAVRRGGRGEATAVLDASPLRVEAACRHFGACGGCALQHMRRDAYHEWKRGRLVEALAAKGIDAPVGELAPCGAESRRRIVLSARRTEAGMLLGYNRALSHAIVDIAECAIARPEIVAALPDLRLLAGIVCATKSAFRLIVTQTASGLDIAVEQSGSLGEGARRKAAAFAIERGYARLSIGGEIIVEPRKPAVMFGGVAVTPPPGGFLQAVAETEERMAALVVAHMAGARSVADLFAGSGAFALRLAARVEAHAVEGDAAALAALDAGYRFGSGLRRVTTERRDLFVRPLSAAELGRFDGVVFDPPRAGAEAQTRQIAKAGVARVAAVSCNPSTLARDLAILRDAGYCLVGVTPFDQFLWSPHVEAVALLEKNRKRR